MPLHNTLQAVTKRTPFIRAMNHRQVLLHTHSSSYRVHHHFFHRQGLLRRITHFQLTLITFTLITQQITIMHRRRVCRPTRCHTTRFRPVLKYPLFLTPMHHPHLQTHRLLRHKPLQCLVSLLVRLHQLREVQCGILVILELATRQTTPLFPPHSTQQHKQTLHRLLVQLLRVGDQLRGFFGSRVTHRNGGLREKQFLYKESTQMRSTLVREDLLELWGESGVGDGVVGGVVNALGVTPSTNTNKALLHQYSNTLPRTRFLLLRMALLVATSIHTFQQLHLRHGQSVYSSAWVLTALRVTSN